MNTSAGVRFFVAEYPERNPYFDKVEYVERWFWRDDNCEEDIGPFDTIEKAELDYKAMRVEV